MDTNIASEPCEILKVEVPSDDEKESVQETGPQELPRSELSTSTQFPYSNRTMTQRTSLLELMESTHSTPRKTNAEVARLFGPPTSQPLDIDGNPLLQAGSLASQLCPLGPKERCTPSQAQAMGQQVLGLMALHESNGTSMPFELQNTFDIFHRCLAVAYGTFFLNLYTKANAPCVLCHGCKSLYPPGQYIHHSCPALPPNIVPCRSRMWRRCLVPLMSQDMNKTDQKERWKFVLEKFSHASMGIGKRNVTHHGAEPQLLEMPECKRGKFVAEPSNMKSSKGSSKSTVNESTEPNEGPTNDSGPDKSTIGKCVGNSSPLPFEEQTELEAEDTGISDEETGGDSTSFIAQETLSAISSSRAINLIKDLIKEVAKLEQELLETKEKLKQTEDRLKAITSVDSLSEQFVHSLLNQEKIMAEKKEAIKKLHLEEEKSSRLEKQLNRIQLLHIEIQNQFKA